MFLNDNIKEKCVGCRACSEICPKQCIEMVKDGECFQYPYINLDCCINCHLCESVCPITFENFNNVNDENCFAGVHKSNEVLYNSSSGGAFTILYEEFIKRGYIVCGVQYENHFKVRHNFAKTIDDCKLFRKSKYVISDTNGCFSKINDFLNQGKKVLFIGSPCQCAALSNYLDLKQTNKYNLFTIDIICHGAPNQDIFDSYIEETENIENNNIINYTFKSKDKLNGEINTRTALIEFTNGLKKQVNIKSDPYMNGYYNRLFYRPSCRICRFARIDRVSDITIGDAWNIEFLVSNWNSQKGVSLILINTKRAEEFITILENQMDLQRVSKKWVIENNSQLNYPTKFHVNRNKFFKYWKQYGFYKAVNKSTKRNIFYKICDYSKQCFLNKIAENRRRK